MTPGFSRYPIPRSILGVLLAASLLAGGCQTLGIRSNWYREGIILGMRDQAKSNKLSRESLEVLYRENLLETYNQNPDEAFRLLLAEILKDKRKQQDPRLVYTAAEFANVLAERRAPFWNRRPFIKRQGHIPGTNPRDPISVEDLSTSKQELLTYYDLATYLSSSYIALASKRVETEAYNPHFRMACELYNYSLEQTLRFTLDAIPFNPQAFYKLNRGQGATPARFKLVGFDWKKEDIHELLPCVDYEPKEINLSSRRQGLGVPMIGIRYSEEGTSPAIYPPVCAFPVTALYIPQETYNLEITESQDTLHLVNPWAQESIQVGKKAIPIEADLTTPLNYMLTRTGFDMDIWSSFRANDETLHGSTFLFQPHRPGRIPVVLCHGLFSNAQPWEALVNGLMDDPWIRKHYEFWFMQYPTGRGLLVNARELRKSLTNLRAQVDPDHHSPSLNHIVFIGHSMGGLIARLLTEDSGNAYWDSTWSVPIDKLNLTPAERQPLQESLFFKRLPFIDRVIFLGTPHHGSPSATNTLGWIGSKLVKLPNPQRLFVRSVEAKNKEYLKKGNDENQMVSVNQLRPDSPVLTTLNSLPIPKEVHYHNIIGDIYGGEEAGDGYVPIESARIPWVESEVVVPTSHTELQGHPLSIKEIARILREHYESLSPEDTAELKVED